MIEPAIVEASQEDLHNKASFVVVVLGVCSKKQDSGGATEVVESMAKPVRSFQFARQIRLSLAPVDRHRIL